MAVPSLLSFLLTGIRDSQGTPSGKAAGVTCKTVVLDDVLFASLVDVRRAGDLVVPFL